MLLRFRVENVLSFRREQELSFVATRYNEHTARETGIVADGRPVLALPVIGIYGANASGKSNTLLALNLMRKVVLSSHSEWGSGEGAPRAPFAFDPAARAKPSCFEVDVLLSGTRFRYGFVLSDERVESEWLYAYPIGRRVVRAQVWFERDADNANPFRFPGDHLQGPRTTLAKLTRDNALFVSAAAANNQPQLAELQRFFRDLRLLTSGNRAQLRGSVARRRMLGPMKARVEALLRAADLGIERIEEIQRDDLPPSIRLVHVTDEGEGSLEFEQESRGTRTWLGLLVSLLVSLDRGSVLLVDELDASLHPVLMAEVIRFYQDRETNPHDAQLVFTAHDPTPMGANVGDRALDRDQLWLTEKGSDGATRLYPLIVARPRKSENLERWYLDGRYGGVPQVGPGQVVRKVRPPKGAAIPPQA